MSKKCVVRLYSLILSVFLVISGTIMLLPSSVFAANNVWTYSYTGRMQAFTAPYTGQYDFKLYGASGGGAERGLGGAGGYAAASFSLEKGTTIYIGVGERGALGGSATFGGGGSSGGQSGVGSGGGATFISYSNSPLSQRSDIIMVAGGGAGKGSSQIHTYMNNSADCYYPIGVGGGWAGSSVYSGDVTNLYEGITMYARGGNVRDGGYSGVRGQDAFCGGGAGGGGWYGGWASNNAKAGGGGGAGYTEYASKTFDPYDSKSGVNIGAGSVRIEYRGTIETTVTLLYASRSTMVKVPAGGNLNLSTSDADSNRNNRRIVGWKVVDGDARITGNTLHVGMTNSVVRAEYGGIFSFNSSRSGRNLFLTWNDGSMSDKYYLLKRHYNNDTSTEVAVKADGTPVPKSISSWNYSTPGSQYGHFYVQVPASGIYRMWAWGAEGGNEGAGLGGEATGQAYLTEGTILHCEVGQRGSCDGEERSAYNGGGCPARPSGGGGGGATHIASRAGVLTSYGSPDNAEQYVYLVAGGGGGADDNGEFDHDCDEINDGMGGSGGGYSGGAGWDAAEDESGEGRAGTQASGEFGRGDDAPRSDNGAGGGGWRGGGGGSGHNVGGGGGSGHITPLVWNASMRNGVRSGHGSAAISLEEVEYRISSDSATAILNDIDAPLPPYNGRVTWGTSNSQSPDNTVHVTWATPEDIGTDNVFTLYSYSGGDLTNHDLDLTTHSSLWHDCAHVCENYKSGLAGYYYRIDNVSTNYGYDSSRNWSQTSSTSVDGTSALFYANRYIHVVAYDYAGNISHPYVITVPVTKYTVRHYKMDLPKNDNDIHYSLVESTTSYGFVGQSVTPLPKSYKGFTSPAAQTISLRYDASSNIINYYYKRNKYNVYYNKNAANSLLYGTPNPSYQWYESLVDTPQVRNAGHYTYRYGWDFMGWNLDKNAKQTYSQGSFFLNYDHDITLYAIDSRRMDLALMYDEVKPVRASYIFTDVIWNNADTFRYTGSDVSAASTRTYGTYYVKFMDNGGSHLIDKGGINKSDGRKISTGLEGSYITVTRWFEGWSEKQQSSGAGVPYFVTDSTSGTLSGPGTLPDYDGTIVGTSGSTFTIKSNDKADTYQDYEVTGNKATVKIHSTDKTARLWPQYSRGYVRLPGAVRNENKKEFAPDGSYTGVKPDKFIGWFTQPQPDDGSSGPGGEYYGKAGDIVRIDKSVTLYPWFNIAPTIVKSKLGEDVTEDVVDETGKVVIPKGFFEGQKVTYDQLLSLIDAYDVDNPAEVGPEGRIDWGGVTYWLDKGYARPWMQLYKRSEFAYVSMMNDAYEWGMTDDELEDLVNAVNKQIGANGNVFWPSVEQVTYYQDGLDPEGNPYPAGVADTVREQYHDEIASKGLITDPDNVGRATVRYKITDNGTFAEGVKIMKGVTAKGGGSYRENSDITVYFDLDIDICFNYNPRLDLVSTYMYTGDERITKDNIEQFLWSKHDAYDRCDDVDRAPWWYTSETGPALDESIKLIGIYDIMFSSGYEIEHPEKCAQVKQIKDIKQLFALKDTDYETFSHITNFKVEWDCVDQWGKTASGYLMPGFDYEHKSGYDVPNLVNWHQGKDRPLLPHIQEYSIMPKAERSMLVIMFNNYDDYDLLQSGAVVAERQRYIDSTWFDYLDEDAYWGDERYGKTRLAKIFDNYDNGTVISNSVGTVDGALISVNDYD